MQPRFQINLFKIFTAEGHQILQPILRIKYSKHKSQSHDQQCLSFTFLQPAHGSNIILSDCRFILQSKKPLLSPCLQNTQCPKTKTNISKIKIYTGINNYRTEIKQHEAGRLTSFSFSLQKDTRTWNQVWKSIYNKKNHLITSNVYSISVNPNTFSFSQ